MELRPLRVGDTDAAPLRNTDLQPAELEAIQHERVRIEAAYRRRRQWEPSSDVYAPWNPASILATAQRKRMAAWMLSQAGVFPRRGQRCLEVGAGSRGWLGDLLDWGLREIDLHGIDLDPDRVQHARETLPSADLRVGDATSLPWPDGTFALVIASTVFSSILDVGVQRVIAGEITRVLAPGGSLLWYDLRVNNPNNPDVRRVTRTQLARLFPGLAGRIQSCTLAPPLARFVTSRRSGNWLLASVLEAIPALRTHLLAVLVKDAGLTSTGSVCPRPEGPFGA
jgi:ubiquinone/menaquinone biosynthesis C-methylase UbiE